MLIKTVKELKQFLEDISDDTPVAFYNYDDREFKYPVRVAIDDVWADDRLKGSKRDYLIFDDGSETND